LDDIATTKKRTGSGWKQIEKRNGKKQKHRVKRYRRNLKMKTEALYGKMSFYRKGIRGMLILL
jgi:hypothetical protein